MSSRDNTSKERLTIKECRKILSENGVVYSDNEIIAIENLLYCFAQIDIDVYYHLKQKEIEDRALEAEKKAKKTQFKAGKSSSNKGFRKAA